MLARLKERGLVLPVPAPPAGKYEPLFLWALGERGRHARTAFAVARLPKNNSVELVVTFAYDPDA